MAAASSSVKKCEVCAAPTNKLCSQCKSMYVCSKECFRLVWAQHKTDCNKLVFAAQQMAEANITPHDSGNKPRPCVFAGDDAQQLLDYSTKGSALYSAFGIEDPPTRGSSMPLKKKIEFFLQTLELYDSSHPDNAQRSLSIRMFLNRRYNNTYKHCLEHLTAKELNRLHEGMRQRHISAANK